MSRSFVVTSALAAALTAGDSLKNYGRATPGSGGFAPSLWATTTPRPGDATFGLRIGSALGGSAGALFLAPVRGSLNISGLEILIDVPSAISLASFGLSGSGPGNGTALVPLPLPNVQSLLAAEFHFQTFIADPAGAWVGVAASPGLTVVPQRPGLLLVTRSVGGSPDAQMAVDLATGSVADFTAGLVDNGAGVAITCGGSHAFVCSGLTRTLPIYDVRTFPGTSVSVYSMQTPNVTPWSVANNPDRRRAYIVTQGPATSTPMVEVMDADPASAGFGQPFPGGGFPAGSISAMEMHFTPDGEVGFLSSLGIGGLAGITRYDTRIGSASYHQSTGILSFPGQFMFASGISADGAVVYAAPAPLGQTAVVVQIDAQTMLAIDWDAGAPGVQHIGSEVSRPVTPTGRVVSGIAADPRGRWLWFSCSGSVAGPAQLVRVDVDPSSAQYQQFALYTTGLSASATLGSVVVSDAGDLVYLASTSDGAVHEINAATLTQVRTFAVGSPSNLALR